MTLTNPTHHTTTTTPAATTTTHSTTTTSYPTTTTGTTNTATSTGATGEKAGQGLKGIFAKGHGVGESIRGNINTAIDSFTGDDAAAAKNQRVLQGGQNEIQTGQFERRGVDKAL